MKVMSDMDYEKAWGDLKFYLKYAAIFAHLFAESEDKRDDDRLKGEGGKIMAIEIVNYMDEIEKEMTTVGEDDGQKVQD